MPSQYPWAARRPPRLEDSLLPASSPGRPASRLIPPPLLVGSETPPSTLVLRHPPLPLLSTCSSEVRRSNAFSFEGDDEYGGDASCGDPGLGWLWYL